MRPAISAAAVVMILFGAFAAAATNDDKAEGRRWWDDVKYLASDDLEGRMTGSAGYQAAAGYVAERFKKEGLKEGGTVGYFQPVQFESHQINEARTTLAIVQGDKTTALKLGEEAFLRPAGDTANQIDAGMVFVGYGMSVPEVNYDDLAGMDLHGKIAVYLAGGPATIKDPLRAHEES
ncbi:MAG: peptidase M28, partial [Candidatus Acidiferrales bacterium]